MLRKPEDWQHYALYAAGVGGHFVDLINQDDGAAGAVDEEILWDGEFAGLLVIVEEAVEGLLVHRQVFDSPDDDLAQEGGVDQIVEMDDLSGVEVDVHIVGVIDTMSSQGAADLSQDVESADVVIGGVFAFEVGIVEHDTSRDAVHNLFAKVGHVVFVEPGIGEPRIGCLLKGGSVAVAEAAEQKLVFDFFGEHTLGGPCQRVFVLNTQCVELGPPPSIGSYEDMAAVGDGFCDEFRFPAMASAHDGQ